MCLSVRIHTVIPVLNDWLSPAPSDKIALVIYCGFDVTVSESDLEVLAFVVAGGVTALAWHWKLCVFAAAAVPTGLA